MKVSHSNTLWLGYKLYSSFVLHGRITLLPLPTLPLGRHHSLQHPCYHYLADSCITYEPYTVLLIGKVLGGITDQHVVSRDALFFFLMFSFSRPSFISSIFVLSLSFLHPFVLSFIFYSFHSLFLGLSLVHSVFPRPLHPLFILTFSLSPLSFICSFFSVSRFVLSLYLSFILSHSLSFVLSFLPSFVVSLL